MLWDCFKHKVVYRDSSFSIMSKEDIKNATRWYLQGKTVACIADKIGVSKSQVYSHLRSKIKMPAAINNSSGIKGVNWDKSRKKWCASYQVNKKRIRVGRFDEAITALREARRSNTSYQ